MTMQYIKHTLHYYTAYRAKNRTNIQQGWCECEHVEYCADAMRHLKLAAINIFIKTHNYYHAMLIKPYQDSQFLPTYYFILLYCIALYV